MKRKPKRNQLIPALLLVLCTIVSAGERVNAFQVQSAVETWVRHVTAAPKPDGRIDRLEPYTADGDTVAFIAHLAGGGFCLCGADKDLLPVYLYNTGDTFDPDNPAYQTILWNIQQKTQYVRQSNITDIQSLILERNREWNSLIAGQAPIKSLRKQNTTESTPAKVELPLAYTWDQGYPEPISVTFNKYCPELEDGTGERTVVGCHGTATAMLMYYWQWPESGTGTPSINYKIRKGFNWVTADCAIDPGIPSSYPWIVDGIIRLNWSNGTLSMQGYWDKSLYEKAQAINSDSDYQSALTKCWRQLTKGSKYREVTLGESYDWDKMTDMWTDQSGNHMAKISYHAAVAAGTNFGVFGSGTAPYKNRNAMVDHFYYHSNATRDLNVDAATLREEIQWMRPLILTGDRPDGRGHAWVVYGYHKDSDQFLMNFGHGGEGNDWYTFDNIDYENKEFNDGQVSIIKLAPEETIGFVGGAAGGTGSPNLPYKDPRNRG
ncbi:MAG: C10 family peptidase [candidate division KSB1 bacterium]|nr:C10 family peptidase [candidate division KSB1 bacterium]